MAEPKTKSITRKLKCFWCGLVETYSYRKFDQPSCKNCRRQLTLKQ